MKILCTVNQAECFRRGIDAPASTVQIDVNPAALPENLRAFVADNLVEGHRLSMKDEFHLRRPDLIGFMEAILVAKDFAEADKDNDKDSFFSASERFRERMKEVDAAAHDKWEKRAKSLAEAQGQTPIVSQRKAGNYDPERVKETGQHMLKQFESKK